MTKWLHSIILVLLLVSLTSAKAATHYNITDFGAVADSVTLNTKAIQNAIDTAYAHGGGAVYVPKGTFLTGALFFKPKTTLLLHKEAILKGSNNIGDYPFIPSRMEGISQNYFAALINANKVDNFCISGEGTIDGNGLVFWNRFWSHVDSMVKSGKPWTNLEVHRPRLVYISNANNILISGIKLRNSGFWTTHIYNCKNIIIENTDIRSPLSPVKAPSTDGIDLDVCKHVVIRGCYLSVNDDAIAIKGGKGPYADKLPENGSVKNVLIENCNFGDSHGCVTIGSECIHAKNITIRNCTVNSDAPILRLKLRPDTPQLYEDITVENITGRASTIISMRPWRQFFDLQGRKRAPFALVRNIHFNNVNVTCDRIGDIDGNPNDVVENIQFKDCDIKTLVNDQINTKYYGVIFFENVKVNNRQF